MVSAIRLAVERIERGLRGSWRPVVLPAVMVFVLAGFLTGALNLSTGDVSEYHRYAVSALHGPFLRRLPLEYPPPALAVFLLPMLLPLPYTWAYAVIAGTVMVALVVSVERSGVAGVDQGTARRLIVYLTLGAVMFLTARYDIFAAGAAFWAYRAARQGRWSAAWTWSSLGFLLKLFPAVLWPALLIAEWRTRRRVPLVRLLWMAGALALIAGVPAIFDPGAVLNEARYYLHRPVEIGSLASGLSLLIDWHSWHYVLSYHSVNTSSPIAAPLAMALSAAAVFGCVAVWWAQARQRLSLEAACLATLSLVVLGGKVLSVQYLLWLMPFWALYRLRVSWVLACIANTVIFPYTVSVLTLGHVSGNGYARSLGLTYLFRDLLVVAGTVLWIRDGHRSMELGPASSFMSPPLAQGRVTNVVPGGGVQSSA